MKNADNVIDNFNIKFGKRESGVGSRDSGIGTGRSFLKILLLSYS